MLPFIDLKTQYQAIKPEVLRRIEQVLENGQYILGAEVQELEQQLADYIGAKHCVTTASGTDALLMSLMSIGVGRGDEVITTPFSFAAAVETVILLGATPVFVDVEPDTCCIDAEQIEAALSKHTKAILPVSLYGQVADMEKINALAAQHGKLPVIEDAAQSLGAEYQGKKSGNLSTLACTSFFPSKPLGCYGDGGAVFTSHSKLAAILRELRIHGQKERNCHTRIGINGRMDTLQCAVLLAKMERFDWEVEQRMRLGARYIDLLKDVQGVRPVQVKSDRSCVWAQFSVLSESRERALAGLKEAGIPFAVHYPVPLHRQAAYRSKSRIAGTLHNAEWLAARIFSLPMHPYLDDDTQDHIVACLRAGLGV